MLCLSQNLGTGVPIYFPELHLSYVLGKGTLSPPSYVVESKAYMIVDWSHVTNQIYKYLPAAVLDLAEDGDGGA